MNTTKNFSPQQLASVSALALSLPVAAFCFFLKPIWWLGLLTFLLVFLAGYGIILYTIQTFVYRKVKLIYKLIYQTKASKREEFYYKNILPQKNIEEVKKDVELWAIQRESEIDTLKRNEVYRKEFLQNLSHELKTPIFAIQGYVDTLLGGAINNETVNMKFLQNTSRNVDRLVNLLDDLDEISKLESRLLKLNKNNFIIQEKLKDVYESLFLKAKEKNIKCLIKKGCEFPLVVYADKDKIRQVLTNLVDNAIKYSNDNGTIEASFYNVDGNNVLIEISDEGVGIAEEHISRVFERFYRTDLARSRKEGGSGLGLSICKHIIEAHGQTIHVRSKLDVGTTFGFSLAMKNEG
jgi:two-component system phosphate regulon sensor histidine kinase PhoR